MDDAELKAQVARAEADRDLARQSLARTQDLLAQKASSQSELERAEATARSNEAQLELLKVRLDAHHGPRAVRRRRRPALREPGRLRDHRHPAGRRSRPCRRSGPSFQVPERYADQLKVGQQVTFRVAALPRAGVRRARGLRGPGGAASRTDDHRQGGGAESQAGAAVRHVHRGPARDGGAAQAPSSFRRMPSSRSRARRSCGWCVRARRPAARWISASARRASSRRGAASRPAEQVVVGGQERLGEGAPVAPKVVDRHSGPHPGELIVRRSALPILSRPRRAGPASLAGSGAGRSCMAQTTRAERTDYRETSTYADVLAFLDSLERAGAGVRIGTLADERRGTSGALGARCRARWSANPSEAHRSGKPVVWLQANIHAGEVEGKEAAQMLLRDLTRGPLRPLLDSLVLIVVPIYNTDGNEHWAPGEENRPGQNGPAIVGRNQNGQGLNLNRDYVKMEAPETRGAAALLEAWDPDVFIDLHTTNGSYHGYALTYAPGLNPNANPGAGLRARPPAAPRPRAHAPAARHRDVLVRQLSQPGSGFARGRAGRPTIRGRGSAPTGWACGASWRC